jgi:hypothetical protein
MPHRQGLCLFMLPIRGEYYTMRGGPIVKKSALALFFEDTGAKTLYISHGTSDSYRHFGLAL